MYRESSVMRRSWCWTTILPIGLMLRGSVHTVRWTQFIRVYSYFLFSISIQQEFTNIHQSSIEAYHQLPDLWRAEVIQKISKSVFFESGLCKWIQSNTTISRWKDQCKSVKCLIALLTGFFFQFNRTSMIVKTTTWLSRELKSSFLNLEIEFQLEQGCRDLQLSRKFQSNLFGVKTLFRVKSFPFIPQQTDLKIFLFSELRVFLFCFLSCLFPFSVLDSYQLQPSLFQNFSRVLSCWPCKKQGKIYFIVNFE